MVFCRVLRSILNPIRNLDELVGKRFKFKVIKLNRKRNNVVLSRRVLLEEELKTQREETLKNLQEGEIVEGTVKNLTDYGAFVDLGRCGWSPSYH